MEEAEAPRPQGKESEGGVKPIPNPKRSVATVFDAVRNLYGGPASLGWLKGRSNRKPSPRKLEPHEVVAKLKARKAVSP